MTTIVLDNAYGGRPEEEVTLSNSDSHPNELGHRLIANRLLKAVREYRDQIGIPDSATF